jgi:hypothetical protein
MWQGSIPTSHGDTPTLELDMFDDSRTWHCLGQFLELSEHPLGCRLEASDLSDRSKRNHDLRPDHCVKVVALTIDYSASFA